MSRKSSFWKSQRGKSRKARHGWQKRSYKQPAMSLERLEDRYMLAADVTIRPGQFFGQNTNPTVSAYEAPFRATFTDAWDQADEDAGFHFYQAAIDWGDGSPLEFSGEPNPPNDDGGANIGVVFHTYQDPFIGHPVVGDAITGRIEGRHNYAATGQYTVTVTLFDSSGDDSAPLSSIVNVYPVDDSLVISADGVTPHLEPYIIQNPDRTERLVGDITEQQPYTFTLDGSAGSNQNITSWTISWGDSIETLDGNPSSAVHAYNNFHDFTYPGDEGGGSHPESHVIISAAVTGENGTYVVHSIEYDIHDAVPVASVEPDSVDVDEGAPYTLNFSYVDATPVQFWLVLWGDEPEDATFDDLTILPADTTSATHVYADGDHDYVVQAIPFNTDGEVLVGFTPAAHVLNVDPTASFSAGGTVNEGSAAGVVAFSDQLDASAVDTTAGFHYAYDFDNDGVFDLGDGTYDGSVSDTSQPVPASFVTDDDATYTVTGRIIDKDGGYTDYTAEFVVLNVAPTATFSGGGTVNEGSAGGTVSFSNQFDPSTADTSAGFHYAYDFNNDGTFDDGDGTYIGSGTSASPSVSVNFLDGDATYNIKARIIDKDGGFTDYTAVINVVNVAPTLTLSGASSVNEGSSYTLNLSSFDPGTDTIDHWTINWGDSTQVVTGNPSSATHTYTDGSASYTISATATDEDGTFNAGNTVAVAVNNVAPTLSLSGAAAVAEGALYTLGLTSSDPGADTIVSWTINWGDSTETISGNPSSATHTYADGSAIYTISATATDEDGTFTAGNTVSVSVTNVDPTASFAGGGTVNEGSAGGTVSFSGQLDPSAADTSAGFHYAYDFNNDGIFDVGNGSYGGSVTATSQPIPASYLTDGDATYHIKGRIIDKDGGFTDYTATILVLNVAPTLAISGGASVNEGSSYTLNLSSFDPGADTINHWTINWGDSTQTVAGNPSSVSHTYADGSNSYTISAKATDEDGEYSAGNTVSVTVNNVAPTLTISGASSVNEGSSYTLNLSKSDPGADTINYWTINWGDVTQVVSGSPSSVTHTYADGSNSYTISATATDEDGTFAAGNTVGVTVNNVAPTLTISGASSVNEGSIYTLNLSKSDPGADTINHWKINWGDGTQTVSGSPTSVTHVYADGSASYTISATATDEDGTFAAGNTVAVTVLNVAPTANAGGPYATFDDAPITLTGSGTDPAGAADPLTFKWDLDGDGIFGETGSGATRGNEVGATVTYNPAGLPTSTQTVKLQVSDGDGGVTVATTTVQILGQGTLAIGGVLYIIGSNTANDIVLITQCNNTITVLATFNSNNPMTFSASSITDIQVRMRGGNDIVLTTSDVMETMTIDGGTGNDLLTGGGARNVIIGGTGNDILYGAAGNDVLLGGDGNDDIFGGEGNDILVGGNGNDILDGGNGRDLLIGSQDEDSLSGGSDEDILIGGYTVHDSNVAALDSIMAIWGSSASFSSRVATLSGAGGLLQANVKVFDDDDHDQLVGDAGRDLYFGDNNPTDHVTDSISLQALQDQLIAVT